MSRRFTWNAWDFDLEGDAYIIAVDQCPERSLVPDFICKEDMIPQTAKPEMVVEEGWCKFQVRSDFYDYEGQRMGFYVAERCPHMATAYKGKRGWFKVWIVRRGEWY